MSPCDHHNGFGESSLEESSLGPSSVSFSEEQIVCSKEDMIMDLTFMKIKCMQHGYSG